MSIEVKIQAQYEQFISATKLMSEFFGGVMDGMKSGLKEMSDQAKIDMKAHESATEQFANILKNNMKGVTGAVEGIKIAWAQLAVIFEAGHFLKSAVTDTIKITTESQKLGRTLGISATQASFLRVALGEVHATTDDYQKIAKGLDNQLKTNEKRMNAFGLETRDSSGHLKDQQQMVLDAMEALRGYKEGTDRNLAAQVLFGRGVNVSSELLALNAEKMAEAKEKAIALGVAVGADDVEASNRFRAAMESMHTIIDGVMKAIGSALLPVLNDLAEWFTTYGPQAILTIKVAIDIVIALFRGFALVVEALGEVFSLVFKNMARTATGFSEIWGHIIHGEWSEAIDAGKSMVSDMGANMGASLDAIMVKAAATGDSLMAMGKSLIDPPTVKDSGKEQGGTEDADITKHKKPKSNKAELAREAAEARRLLKEKYDAVMEEYKGEEQAARENLQAVLEIQRKEYTAAVSMYGEKSKQAIAAGNRIAETERKIAELEEQLNLKRAESHRKIARMMIDDTEKAAQERVQMGDETARQLIRQQMDYEDQRYALDRANLIDEAAANIERVQEHAATLLKIEELDAQHELKKTELERQAAMERMQTQKQVEGVMAGAFSNAIMAMVNKTMTFKQAMKSMFGEILQGIVHMLAQWAAKLAAHYIMDKIMHAATERSKTAAAKAAAKAAISSAAGVAGANGTASWAGAPWPIDMAAVGFGGAMAAAAGSFATASAAEGFDIPAGVNPVTQLHQKEMVLPAPQADVIRKMSEGDGEMGGGDTYHIAAHDPQSFMEYLRRNPRAMAEGVKRAGRMGYLGAAV